MSKHISRLGYGDKFPVQPTVTKESVDRRKNPKQAKQIFDKYLIYQDVSQKVYIFCAYLN